MNFRLTNSCIAFAFQIALILPVIATPSATAAPQTTETTPQADGNQKLNQLIKTATRTQASGDLKQAATQWQAVWQQFPDSQLSGPARFQAGFCHQQLKDYPQAIEHLKAAIPDLAAANEQLPTAKFYLGYCQFQLGQQNLRTATDATVRKQATDLVATATVTLQRLLKTHPSFPDTVQAYYFLGGCFEELGRKQDAIDAYQQMANVPNPNDVFKYESTFAIADLNFELGQYGQAKQYFDKLLTDPNNKQRPDRNLVVYTAAETSIALGTAAKQNGIGQSSKQHFADAEALLNHRPTDHRRQTRRPTGSRSPTTTSILLPTTEPLPNRRRCLRVDLSNAHRSRPASTQNSNRHQRGIQLPKRRRSRTRTSVSKTGDQKRQPKLRQSCSPAVGFLPKPTAIRQRLRPDHQIHSRRPATEPSPAETQSSQRRGQHQRQVRPSHRVVQIHRHQLP